MSSISPQADSLRSRLTETSPSRDRRSAQEYASSPSSSGSSDDDDGYLSELEDDEVDVSSGKLMVMLVPVLVPMVSKMIGRYCTFDLDNLGEDICKLRRTENPYSSSVAIYL
ncbi:hypothetical protein HK104_010095 [Borealophlyctis nickersoniae]|nr:hypothetical protein HK104_010095 [Borealophlyctis nickersoniae]